MEIEVLLDLIEIILTQKDDICVFVTAISRGKFNLFLFDYFLNEGNLPNKKALLAATQARQIEIVRFILEHGVKPTLESFQYAAEHEFYELCRLFVKFGSREILSTPELEKEFIKEIMYDCVENPKKLANMGVDFTTNDNFAIQTASKMGNFEIVHLLLKYGIVRSAKNLAIQRASGEGHLEVVRLLLEDGVDNSAKNQAIKWASEYGYLEVVQLLLDNGAEPKTDKNYAIVWASYYSYLDIIRLLLKYGANPTDNDNQAIKLASWNGHSKVVELLLEHGALF
jgi:ankyrin repeat protein